MFERTRTTVTEHKTALLVILLLIMLLLILGIVFSSEEQLTPEKPVVMTQEETQDVKELRNQLDISGRNAADMQRKLADVQRGGQAPSTTYYITAPTVERAATVVERQIRTDDATLPMAAREKTDRTVVTPIVKDKDGKDLPADQQKVDVYKINLRKDHRVKAGATMIDGKALMSIGYEQGRFEALAHFDGARCRGATLMYNVAEW